MKKHGFKATLGVVVASGMLFVGLAQPASAQSDEQIIVDNLPAAVEALVAGLEEAAAVAQDSQSAVETSDAIGDAVVAGGTALVTGTAQFGALPQGLTLLDSSVQGFLSPYLGAIDDPGTAAELVNPDDLSTLAANLQPAIDASMPYLTSAVVEGLRGNLVKSFILPGLGTPALLGDAFNGVLGLALFGLDGTNYESAATLFLVPALVVGGVLEDYLQQAEDAGQPLFEGATPITDPLIELIEGV